MAISLKHSFNCAKADGLDATAVKPSDWNAEHTLTAASGKVLGTAVGSTTVTELPIAVDSTGQAMTPPSGSTASRPASPTAGMIRFNTTTAQLEAYVSSTWREVAAEAFPSGTRMLFQQTSAPTGWTKDTTHNDKAMRVVNGAVGSGGYIGFTSAFANRAVSDTAAGGTVWGHVLTWGQMPAHQHLVANGVNATGGLNSGNYINYQANYSTNNDYTLAGNASGPDRGLTSSAGGNEAHSHGFSGAAHNHTLDLTVQYVDVIIAQKN